MGRVSAIWGWVLSGAGLQVSVVPGDVPGGGELVTGGAKEPMTGGAGGGGARKVFPTPGWQPLQGGITGDENCRTVGPGATKTGV
jgi:hypothetical protein